MDAHSNATLHLVMHATPNTADQHPPGARDHSADERPHLEVVGGALDVLQRPAGQWGSAAERKEPG